MLHLVLMSNFIKLLLFFSFCKLQYLDLSMATIAPEALADILAVCNKLKKLSLEACEVNEDCCKYVFYLFAYENIH